MEGSSSRAVISQEGSNPLLPLKISFSQLNSYFDRLDQKLKDPVLHTINDHVTELVQSLLDKQKIVSDRYSLIFRRFFDVFIVGNLEVAANTWEEVAVLNLLGCWFTFEEEKIEEKLTEIVRNLVSSQMVSYADIGHLLLSRDAALHVRIIQDSNMEDKEVVHQEPGHQAGSSAHKEEMRTWVEGPENHHSEGGIFADNGKSVCALSDTFNMLELEDKLRGMSEAEKNYHDKLFDRKQCKMKEPMKQYDIPYKNNEWLNGILSRTNMLENRAAFSMVDLFFLLKRHGLEITKITQFKAALEGASGKGVPQFINEIVDLLELADKQLDMVGGCWKLEGIDDNTGEHNPLRLLQESIFVDRLLHQLMRLVLKLEGLRRSWCLSGMWPLAKRYLASLDYRLGETGVELDWIEKNVDQLRRGVKDGRFTGVVTALSHAADCIIQSVKI